jgi:hypothetical protein
LKFILSFKEMLDKSATEIQELILDCKAAVEGLGGQMTSPFFEIKDNQLVLVWATFLTNLNS